MIILYIFDTVIFKKQMDFLDKKVSGPSPTHTKSTGFDICPFDQIRLDLNYNKSNSNQSLLIDVFLLCYQIFGRNLLWYGAVFGAITAISRAAVSDELLVLDPHGTMSLVVQHTHYMPKRWRMKENTEFVRMEFETLFQVCLFCASNKLQHLKVPIFVFVLAKM